jgi:hypothetical protein
MTYFDTYNFKSLSDGGFDKQHQLILDEINSIRQEKNCPDLIDILEVYTSKKDIPVYLECFEVDIHEEIDDSLAFFEEGFEDILQNPEDVFRIDYWRYWTFWAGISIYIIDKFSPKKWAYIAVNEDQIDEMYPFEATSPNNATSALL